LRSHSTVSASDMIRSIVNVARHLGLRNTANESERLVHEEHIRDYSQFLLGNVRARMPFPDPDLGEWGMDPQPPSSDW